MQLIGFPQACGHLISFKILLLTVPKTNYVLDSQGQKVFVQLSVQEWEHFIHEFRRMESLLSFKKKLKNAFREVREIQRGERVGQTLGAGLGLGAGASLGLRRGDLSRGR